LSSQASSSSRLFRAKHSIPKLSKSDAWQVPKAIAAQDIEKCRVAFCPGRDCVGIQNHSAFSGRENTASISAWMRRISSGGTFGGGTGQAQKAEDFSFADKWRSKTSCSLCGNAATAFSTS